ncbi:uncharacterized protein VTP21DRAFT_5808 [Calcarisporiella thermophila]|uniref:uncharacterized protein n=1 Tax=Calcarisporiella thermophila TaxID=911321 RepID=UPI00374311CB
MQLFTVAILLLGLSATNAVPLQEKDELEAQIIGGEKAQPGELPFAVKLSNGCTGSIISDKVVLSAAHCHATSMSIYYGSVDYRSGTRVGVQRAVVHEGYNRNRLKNDIMLLFLESPIRIGPNAKPITIAKDPAAPGSKVWAAGYGVTKDPGGSPSPVLMKVSQTIGDDTICKRDYNQWEGQKGSQICLKPEANRGVCYGDSGGPLYSANNGTYQLLGATSFGSRTPCASGQTVAYFTRVGYFIDWIRSKGVPV